MTGTPLPNTPEEAYGLLRFIGAVKDTDFDNFRTNVVEPITQRLGTKEDDFETLRLWFYKHLLRKTKDTVYHGKPIVALPPLIIHQCTFSAREERLYWYLLKVYAHDVRQAERVRADNAPGMTLKEANLFVFASLTRLYQACIYPSLILVGHEQKQKSLTGSKKKQLDDNEDADDEEADEKKAIATCPLDPRVLELVEDMVEMEDIPAKTKFLTELINNTLKEDPKAIFLIFSKWTTHIEKVQDALMLAGHEFLIFEGSTTVQNKEWITANYAEPLHRGVLISFLAGGVGLTLTKVTHLVHLNPHYNPQVELQAYDRSYRIGQTRPITEHPLIAESISIKSDGQPHDTIDDRVLAAQVKKLNFVVGAFGYRHEGFAGGTTRSTLHRFRSAYRTAERCNH